MASIERFQCKYFNTFLQYCFIVNKLFETNILCGVMVKMLILSAEDGEFDPTT